MVEDDAVGSRFHPQGNAGPGNTAEGAVHTWGNHRREADTWVEDKACRGLDIRRVNGVVEDLLRIHEEDSPVGFLHIEAAEEDNHSGKEEEGGVQRNEEVPVAFQPEEAMLEDPLERHEARGPRLPWCLLEERLPRVPRQEAVAPKLRLPRQQQVEQRLERVPEVIGLRQEEQRQEGVPRLAAWLRLVQDSLPWVRGRLLQRQLP